MLDAWAVHPSRSEVFLTLSSRTSPPRVFRYSAGTVADTGWLLSPPPGADALVTADLRVPARDGTLIPLRVTYRPGLMFDGTSPAIASRLRRLWEDYENAIARLLADEANEAAPTPRTRLVAAQLTAMIRVITSTEVREFVARHPNGDPGAALQDWISEAQQLLGRGLE